MLVETARTSMLEYIPSQMVSKILLHTLIPHLALNHLGSPSITSVLFDRNTTTLTCTSTGGPPTTVTWRKNGVLVNDSLYHQSQRVVNTESATYENVLFNDDVANFVGMFTCEVSNVRGVAEETVELNGCVALHRSITITFSHYYM